MHQPLGNEDGVLEVVAVPGHEGHQQVLAQGQLAHAGGGAVGEHIAGRHPVALAHLRALVHAGVLVGALVLHQVVDVHARLAGAGVLLLHAHHDARRVQIVHQAGAARHGAGSGIDRHRPLHAGAHQRRFGAQRGHGLALHVRAHQRAVGVAVLEEGNQRRGHGYRLARRNVHVLDALALHQRGLVAVADPHQRLGESAFVRQPGVGLGNDVLAFLDGREVIDDVGDLAVGHPPVRRFQDAVFVGARVDGERVDQPDVRAFRGLDRTHAAVMRGMHVAHLEAGPLAGQAAGAQRRDAPLVGGLGQRIVLVHELRELVRTEKFLDGRRYRLGVDHLLRHEAVAFGHGEALLDRPLHARQALAQRVFGHLAHAAHAAVAEVVDVVDVVLAVADAQQHAQHLDDVFGAQNGTAGGLLAPHAAVELHPADP